MDCDSLFFIYFKLIVSFSFMWQVYLSWGLLGAAVQGVRSHLHWQWLGLGEAPATVSPHHHIPSDTHSANPLPHSLLRTSRLPSASITRHINTHAGLTAVGGASPVTGRRWTGTHKAWGHHHSQWWRMAHLSPQIWLSGKPFIRFQHPLLVVTQTNFTDDCYWSHGRA